MTVTRLFVNPFYCGVLLEQSMLMNRRCHDREIDQNNKGQYRMLETEEYRWAEQMEEDEDVINAHQEAVPMVYACATMWHETKNEMTQLLKSLFRYV